MCNAFQTCMQLMIRKKERMKANTMMVLHEHGVEKPIDGVAENVIDADADDDVVNENDDEMIVVVANNGEFVVMFDT